MAGVNPRWVGGWRGLGLFWSAVLGLTAFGAIVLEILGPPAMPAPEPGIAEPAVPVATARDGEILPPQPALLEPSKAFPPAMLPRIGAGGRMARIVYARPFDVADKRPRIAVVITGLGMSEADSRSAIQSLPPPISLAFSPYAANPDPLAQFSRTTGHEMLISLPLEPQGFPLNDAGSRSLLTGASAQQNALNLEWSLGRLEGYVGAIGAVDGMRGERFADQTSSWTAMLSDLSHRGLLYVDPRPGKTSDALGPVPGRSVDVVIDDPPARAEIEAKLAALERLARDKGSAIGLAGPLRPVTIELIAAWAKGLGDRGIALAPVSALIGGGAK